MLQEKHPSDKQPRQRLPRLPLEQHRLHLKGSGDYHNSAPYNPHVHTTRPLSAMLSKELLLCASIRVAFTKPTSDNALLLELNLLRQQLLTTLLEHTATSLGTVHRGFSFLQSPPGSDQSQQRETWV